MPRMHWRRLRFGFQLPKELRLELTGQHFTFSCSEHISCQAIINWHHRLHLFGQRLKHRLQSTISFPTMFRLREQSDSLAKMYTFILFTHLYQLLNKKAMLIHSLIYGFIQTLHIKHQRCQFCRHSGLGRRCYVKCIDQLN